MDEFSIIRNIFSGHDAGADLGIGDDCALLVPQNGCRLAVTSDTLNEGVHFFKDSDPQNLGHKCLAVNLSDLAAMGATPRWFTLAISLPSPDYIDLRKFADGMFALAKMHGISLVGGDTTKGPLSVSITAMGEVPNGQAITRHGAKPGDLVFVTGNLGGAALAVACGYGKYPDLDKDRLIQCRTRLDLPEPRIAAGLALRGIASAMLDISDGIIQDLGHICERSACGAEIYADKIPIHPALYEQSINDIERLDLALAGGDDYELCFTSSPENADEIKAIAENTKIPIADIGKITDKNPDDRQVRVLQGKALFNTSACGYNHFA